MRKLYSFALALVLVAPAAFAQGNFDDNFIDGEFDLVDSYGGMFTVDSGDDTGRWVAGIPVFGDTTALCANTGGFSGSMTYVQDLGPEQTPGGEACNDHLPILNDLTGKIALVRRGVCAFVEKMTNVQAVGATGIVIYNDERVDPPDDTTLIVMGGDPAPTNFLPGLFIGFRLGQSLANQIELSGDIDVNLSTAPYVEGDSDGDGTPDVQLPVYATCEVVTAVEPLPGTIATNKIAAYPNPTSGMASIALAVDRAQHVDVAVYDILGRQVAQVFSGALAGGVQELFDVDTAGFPAGLYFVRATGEAFASTQQLTVVR